ncbi:MAG TPA: glucose 1-dehydrogenase [Blastocatellia bacterium]|nr:glucose 1-dehydrogenase [Blastocatellia bacterium]
MNKRQRPLDEEFQMPSFRLDGRTALVTGGSRGLGLGAALTLAHSGADVALMARSAEELAKAAELVRRTGRNVLTLAVDATDTVALRNAVQNVAKDFGRLDILVNAAGMNIRQPVDTFTEEDWDRVMSVNLKAMFFASQEAARVMREAGGGKIINFSSMSSEVVLPNIALYAISKGGVRQMTRALALEWARDRICVNAIAPGRFWTQMTDKVFSVPELYDDAVSIIPQKRPGVPSDLAGAVLLLASDASDYITGQTIFVDGGWSVNAGVRA